MRASARSRSSQRWATVPRSPATSPLGPPCTQGLEGVCEGDVTSLEAAANLCSRALDDILFIASDEETVQEAVKEMKKDFELGSVEPVQWITKMQ
ncbi:hypothetical protein HDU96_000630, partial [Phlyctochytrium bullatum]